MSNLGRYQEIVTDARSVGGVENYLKLIEANAVASAAPRLVARGAAVTLVAVGGLAGLAFEINRRIDARRALTAAAEAARHSLTSVRPTADSVDGSEQGIEGSRVPTCAWCGEPGHDRRSCDVPLDAGACDVCGFRGHDKRDCPRNSRSCETRDWHE